MNNQTYNSASDFYIAYASGPAYLDEPKFIVVPYWIANAIRLNKRDYMDLLDYKKAREILSLQDMADLVQLQSLPGTFMFSSDGVGFAGDISALVSSWRVNISEKDLAELNNAVIPMTKLPVDNLVERLKTPDENGFDSDTIYDGPGVVPLNKMTTAYNFSMTKNKVCFITLKKNSLNSLTERKVAKEFLSDLLKSMYTFMSIRQVNNSWFGGKIFRYYLDHIA